MNKSTPLNDKIHHPSHYCDGGIETMKTVSAEDINCMWRMIGFAKMQCLTE